MGFAISAALLDYCVLGLVSREDEYGYSVTQKMQEVMEISESTLYPVLRRLKKAGLLETYDRPFQGRNRRYYRMTEAGREQLEAYHEDWREFRSIVETLTGAGDLAGQGSDPGVGKEEEQR